MVRVRPLLDSEKGKEINFKVIDKVNIKKDNKNS
jgi:hypothetical protein